MLLKELLKLNYNGEYLSIYLDGTDGLDWFYKKHIPEAFKNYKVLNWKIDGEDLHITIDGEIFADRGIFADGGK